MLLLKSLNYHPSSTIICTDVYAGIWRCRLSRMVSAKPTLISKEAGFSTNHISREGDRRMDEEPPATLSYFSFSPAAKRYKNSRIYLSITPSGDVWGRQEGVGEGEGGREGGLPGDNQANTGKKGTKQRITTWNVRNSGKNKTKDLANYEEMPDGPKIDAKGWTI